MLIAILLVALLILLVIIFRPKRSPYVRRVTPSYNGQDREKSQELY